VEDELVTRTEITGFLFNVADIARSLGRMEELLKEGGDDGEEEAPDEG
jgi:hypothetical protein